MATAVNAAPLVVSTPAEMRNRSGGAWASTSACSPRRTSTATPDVCSPSPRVTPSSSSALVVSRRGAVAWLLAAQSCGAAMASPTHTHTNTSTPVSTLYVSPDEGANGTTSFTTLTAALASASPGARIIVSPGTYRERLVMTTDAVSIVAAFGGVILEHKTNAPYEHVVECTASGVALVGVAIRHSSPSVANNYAVFVTPGSSLTMTSCDVSSETGSGVGAEGAALLVMEDCVVHDCKSHGVAVYGNLDADDDSGPAMLTRCQCRRNGLNGVLARGGARITATEVIANDNRGGYGFEFINAGGDTVRCEARGNGRGAMRGGAVNRVTEDNNVFFS